MLTGNETVTIVRHSRTGQNEYGLPVDIESEISVSGVLVAFGGTAEPVSDNEDPITVDLSLYFPPGTSVLPNDEFIVRGERFVKAGRQQDWNSPFASLETGVVVNVRQRLG